MTEQPTTELAPPTSMEDVKERIALRIKASFVELMPEDAWTKMVQSEIKRFTEAPYERGYSPNRLPPLHRILREVLEERYRGMLKVELAKPEYAAHFGVNGEAEPGEFIKGFIKENMAAILTALLGGLGQGLVEQVKNSIQQDAANRY